MQAQLRGIVVPICFPVHKTYSKNKSTIGKNMTFRLRKNLNILSLVSTCMRFLLLKSMGIYTNRYEYMKVTHANKP